MHVDYRALLIRYMARVIDAESVSFIDGDYFIKLTVQEKQHLWNLFDEVMAELDKGKR